MALRTDKATQDATSKWLKKMRQQFHDKKFCDVTIRVTLQQTTLSSLPSLPIVETTPQPHTVDIPCHSNVLSTRSDYFDRALDGDFSESKTKIICITRDDNEELKYFILLLELSYGPSYIHDDEGDILDRDVRIHLALVANEFEFEECMHQCVSSLRKELGLAEQIMCVETELSALQGRKCMQEWKKTIHTFFEEGPIQSYSGTFFYKTLSVTPIIKALSTEGMEALLECDKITIMNEDEAYYLLGAWLHQSSHVKTGDRVSVFKSLASKIRFHHISTDYLACVVTHCPLAHKSGLVVSFLQSGLVYREANSKLLAEQEIVTGACNRGTGKEKWTFSTFLLLDDVMTLEKGNAIFKYLGVAAGFPIQLRLERGKDKDTLGLFNKPLMPDLRGGSFAPCLDRNIGLEVCFQVTSITKVLKRYFDGKDYRGYHDFFSKPWQEVVHAGSSYFPEGKMSVTITVKKITKDDK